MVLPRRGVAQLDRARSEGEVVGSNPAAAARRNRDERSLARRPIPCCDPITRDLARSKRKDFPSRNGVWLQRFRIAAHSRGFVADDEYPKPSNLHVLPSRKAGVHLLNNLIHKASSPQAADPVLLSDGVGQIVTRHAYPVRVGKTGPLTVILSAG